MAHWSLGNSILTLTDRGAEGDVLLGGTGGFLGRHFGSG